MIYRNNNQTWGTVSRTPYFWWSKSEVRLGTRSFRWITFKRALAWELVSLSPHLTLSDPISLLAVKLEFFCSKAKHTLDSLFCRNFLPEKVLWSLKVWTDSTRTHLSPPLYMIAFPLYIARRMNSNREMKSGPKSLLLIRMQFPQISIRWLARIMIEKIRYSYSTGKRDYLLFSCSSWLTVWIVIGYRTKA